VLLVLAFSIAPAYAALEVSTDHRSLFFGLMQPGERKTLAERGAFHNTVTVTSTGGRTWYLKISLLRPLSSGAETIPLERLRWQLIRTDGIGTAASQREFRSFSLVPDLVYIAAPGEADGRPVRFEFSYALELPEAVASGVYSTTIRFTLTEVL
jgi:hypothetical protein